MSTQTPSPETVIARALEAAMRRMNTAEPGIVQSYNATACTADIQPAVLRVVTDENGDRVTQRAPVLSDVPVLFPGGGGMRLTFPVKAGDLCLLVYSGQPLDQWHQLGGEVDPKTSRHHHISDAVAIVGLTPAGKATAAPSSTATVLEGSDIRLGDASAQLLALKSDVDALRTFVASHTHAASLAVVGSTASGTTAIPNGSPDSVVGTTKTKAS